MSTSSTQGASAAPQQGAHLDAGRAFQEILRLDEDVRCLGAQVDKYMTLLGLVAAAIVTISLAADKPKPLIAVVAPYALAFLLSFLAQIYTDIEVRICLREALERLHPNPSGEALSQASVIDHSYRNRLSVRLTGLVLAAGYVSALITSIVEAGHVFSGAWVIVHYAGLLASAVAPAIAMWELQTCSKRVPITH